MGFLANNRKSDAESGLAQKIYFPAAGARRRSSSKKFSRKVTCAPLSWADAPTCTTAKRLTSGARL
jgi:hypothetical protein